MLYNINLYILKLLESLNISGIVFNDYFFI